MTLNSGRSPATGSQAQQDGIDDAPRPTRGRVYGYLNGGRDAFASERALGQELTRIFSGMREVARENRMCVNGRVPRYLAEQGFRQFLDLGCGLPDEPLLHEAVQDVMPWARVAYVDNDEGVLVHARSAYAFHSGLAVVNADIADIDSLLKHRDLRQVLDPVQPVVVIAGAALHFLPDKAVVRVVDDLAAGLAAGSVMAISHATGDDEDPEKVAEAVSLYKKHVGPMYLRSADKIRSLLGDRRPLAGLCRTYELLPEHPDDVELARSVAGAPHFYATIVELSPDPLRAMTVLPARMEGTAA